MDERQSRIRKLAYIAVAYLDAGFDEVQTMDRVEDAARTLWEPSYNTLRDYVAAAMNEAKAILGARRKNLYTWTPRYSDTEP